MDILLLNQKFFVLSEAAANSPAWGGLPNRTGSATGYFPYHPLDRLSASLSSADIHAVVMGDAFVGIVHPSKVYNIRQVGVPFFYIGPAAGPIAELDPTGSFRHGDAQGVAGFIAAAAGAEKLYA